MKKRAGALLRHIVALLSSIAKAKSVASEGVKMKTSTMKAKVAVMSMLIKNKKVAWLNPISHKIKSTMGHLAGHDHEQDGDNDQSKALVLYNNNNNNNDAVNAPGEHQHHQDCCSAGSPSLSGQLFLLPPPPQDDDYEDQRYPDLTHSLFDDDDDDRHHDGNGSVIEMVRNSKQHEGQEFSLEDEIDHVADLFITRFHKQMRLQKLESFKRYQEMLRGREASN